MSALAASSIVAILLKSLALFNYGDAMEIKQTPVSDKQVSMVYAKQMNLDAYHSIINCTTCKNSFYRILIPEVGYRCPCQLKNVYENSKGRQTCLNKL